MTACRVNAATNKAVYAADEADQACERLVTAVGMLVETLPGYAGVHMSEITKLTIAIRAICARLRQARETNPQ